MNNKRYSILLLMVAAITLLVRCSPKATKAVATTEAGAPATPDEKVADIRKHYSDAQMEEGKTIFNNSCGRCHKLKMPETRTVAAWEQILPGMSKKAALNEEQYGLVRAYVLPLAKKG